MTREAQALVRQLREEGLGDEEVVWYAVNMHDADENEIRTELQQLHAAKQKQPEERETVTDDRRSPSPTSVPKRETVAARPPESNGPNGPNGPNSVGDRQAGDVPSMSSSASAGIADNGYWIALKVLLLSSIISSLATKLFVVPDMPYRMEEQLGTTLYFAAFGGLVVWTLLRQVEISVPGSRWAGILRAVLYGAIVVAGHNALSAVMWPEYMPGFSYIVRMMFVSLLFFEVLTLLRRWLVPIGIPFFIALHIVLMDGVWWIALGLTDALWSGGPFLETFLEVKPFLMSDEASTPEIVAVALHSTAEVLFCWALFAFCGKYERGATLTGWGAAVLRAPTRLVRGEFGFARSFWYAGVLGWMPIRIFNLYALHEESQAMLIGFSVVNAAFWMLVAYVLWRASKGYTGHKAWPVLAGLWVLLGLFASAGAVAGLEG